MFRFLHSSDLHLGKAFGGYPEGIRNRLREARHGAIARLASEMTTTSKPSRTASSAVKRTQ